MPSPVSAPPKRPHCMVVHSYFPLREPRVEREAKALVGAGYEVDVICLRREGESAFAREPGIRIFRLPVRRHKGQGALVQLGEYLAFFALAFIRLTALHLRRRYGVVQVHNLPDFLVFAALVPKLAGARIILDLHDLMPEFYAGRFGTGMSSWPVRLLCWQERLACRFADRVISVTDLWKQRLVERGVPAEKIQVVMNAADDQIFFRAPNGATPDLSEQRFKLIYHGTLTHRYGLDLVIHAVDRVRQQLPGVHLTIHGTGEAREALMRLVADLGMGEHVRFSTEVLPLAELPRLIRRADLAVVPYRRDVLTDEILPTKMMEYAALGVPILAARTRAIAAYFDETMVEFFTPEDVADLARHILALSQDRERLRALSRNSARFTRRYSWPTQAAGYLRMVDHLATPSGSPA